MNDPWKVLWRQELEADCILIKASPPCALFGMRLCLLFVAHTDSMEMAWLYDSGLVLSATLVSPRAMYELSKNMR